MNVYLYGSGHGLNLYTSREKIYLCLLGTNTAANPPNSSVFPPFNCIAARYLSIARLSLQDTSCRDVKGWWHKIGVESGHGVKIYGDSHFAGF
jgi:hypothetical protein